MRTLRLVISFIVAATMIPVFTAGPANAEVDIYITEGNHNVNGRQWRTICEPYSATKRCRTEIFATQVSEKDGIFTQTNDWVFNNLTYAPSPRALWKGNPIAGNGEIGGKVSWTAADGRKWRTECDTPVTGNGGCRSYIQASVIEAVKDAAGNTRYQWTTKEILNNMVRFSAPAPAPKPTTPAPKPTVPAPQPTTPVKPTPKPSPKPTTTPTASPTAPPTSEPTEPPADPLNFIQDPGLKECLGHQLPEEITAINCAHDPSITTLAGIEHLTNLTHLTLNGVGLVDITALSGMPQLEMLDLRSNLITDVSPLASLTGLTSLKLRGNPDISNIHTLDALLEAGTDIDIYLPYPKEPVDLSSIRDPRLLSCIQQSTGIGNALILQPEQIVAFESLDCSNRGISTLEGLPEFQRLTALNLTDNQISSIDPLVGHRRLDEVQLVGNPVKDLLSAQDLPWGGWANDLQLARQKASPLAALDHGPVCPEQTYIDGTGYRTWAGSLLSSYLYEGVEQVYVVQTDRETCVETIRHPIGWPELTESPWSINEYGFLWQVYADDHVRLELIDWDGLHTTLHESPADAPAAWAASKDRVFVVSGTEMLTLSTTSAPLSRTALPYADGLDPASWMVLDDGTIRYWATTSTSAGQLCEGAPGSTFSCTPLHASSMANPDPEGCSYASHTAEGTFWQMFCGRGPYWVAFSTEEVEPLYLPDLEYASRAIGIDSILYYIDLNDGGLYKLVRSGPELVKENAPIGDALPVDGP